MNATIKRATFEITDEEAIDLFHALKRDLEYTIDTHWNRHLATLRRERDELRAELLTTHQMACRVGLERDELAKLLGEVADELAVPGYDAPPISKGVQNLLSRIRAALQSLRALTEQPGKP